MPQSLTPLELEFLKEARGNGLPESSGMVDVSCFLLRHQQDPDGLIDLVGWADERNLTLEKAEETFRPRTDRRSVLFGCGDCDQFHELMAHHRNRLDNQPHVLADNGGAILLDRRVRVERGFNTAEYWPRRICASVDMKFVNLSDNMPPEVYPYAHLICGQARKLGFMAWDSVISACRGKQVLKDISKRNQRAWVPGKDHDLPFRVGLLLHVDYGSERRKTYYIRRHKIMPIAHKYAQLHRRQGDNIVETVG